MGLGVGIKAFPLVGSLLNLPPSATPGAAVCWVQPYPADSPQDPPHVVSRPAVVRARSGGTYPTCAPRSAAARGSTHRRTWRSYQLETVGLKVVLDGPCARYPAIDRNIE